MWLQAISILWIVLSGVASAAPIDSWDRVEQIRSGDRVRVVLPNRQDVRAQFAGTTSNTLQLLLRDKGQVNIPRTEVRRIYVVLRRSHVRAAAPWIGAAAGAGVGAGVGWAVGVPCSGGSSNWPCIMPRTATTPVFGAVGAGIGALIGHFASGRAEMLVYRHP